MKITVDNVIKILRHIDGVDTTSAQPNDDIITAVKSFFAQNFDDGDFEIHDVPSDANPGCASLIIKIGPDAVRQNAGGLMIAGHMDTVEFQQQPTWQSDPLMVEIRDGKIYRRGATDMWGQIATVFASVAAWLERQKNGTITEPLTILLSCDEETKTKGIEEIMAFNQSHNLFQPKGCFVIEPTEMKPIIGHRGVHRMTIRVNGHTGHTSDAALGINAGRYLLEIMNFVQTQFPLYAAQYPYDKFSNPQEIYTEYFNTPHGIATNAIPDYADGLLVFRTNPNSKLPEFIDSVRQFVKDKIAPQMKMEFDRLGLNEKFAQMVEMNDWCALWAFENKVQSDFVNALVGQSGFQPDYVLYGTDAGPIAAAGIPTIVFAHGSIATAHQPNECITFEEIEAGLHFFGDKIFDLLVEPDVKVKA